MLIGLLSQSNQPPEACSVKLAVKRRLNIFLEPVGSEHIELLVRSFSLRLCNANLLLACLKSVECELIAAIV